MGNNSFLKFLFEVSFWMKKAFEICWDIRSIQWLKVYIQGKNKIAATILIKRNTFTKFSWFILLLFANWVPIPTIFVLSFQSACRYLPTTLQILREAHHASSLTFIQFHLVYVHVFCNRMSALIVVSFRIFSLNMTQMILQVYGPNFQADARVICANCTQTRTNIDCNVFS